MAPAGPGASPFDAQRAADAFKAVALTWVARNQASVQQSSWLSSLKQRLLACLLGLLFACL